MIRITFFILVLIACLSCKRDDDSVPALTGIEYFPTDSGSYRIYDVRFIQYDNDTIDSTYQMREVIHDTFYFNNTLVYELYRYYRANETQPWQSQPDSVWSFTTDHNQITIQEISNSFVRLVFPLSNGEVWDANTKNVFLRDDVTATNVGKPYTVNNVYFPETCNVIEEQSKNLVYKDYRNRVYAKNIGMIYKRYEFLSYNTSDEFIGQDKVDFGSIREEKLVAYGKP
ncbi:MAG: hypothetical protein ACTHJT_14215 [Cytophaga sp.]|uniref:hypothetical protein n=1 Tax=Cytophaga sp. TaxID=29535 RepID=UPI003F81ED85